jgi:hypothetical protein
MIFAITMLVLGIIDKIRNKKKGKKPDPLKKGVIKFMMVDLNDALGGKDLEIYDSSLDNMSSSSFKKEKNVSIMTKKKGASSLKVWKMWKYSKNLKSKKVGRKARKNRTEKPVKEKKLRKVKKNTVRPRNVPSDNAVSRPLRLNKLMVEEEKSMQ